MKRKVIVKALRLRLLLRSQWQRVLMMIKELKARILAIKALQQPLRHMRYVMLKYERHPRMRQLHEVVDHVVDVVSHRQYTGDNPAIAAIYSPLRVSLMIVIALFVVIFVFGSLVPINSAAIASGKITVLSNKKTVQHLEGGIIKDILVKEGDIVKKGQPLIELNDIAPKASKFIVQNEVNVARVTEIRLAALKDNLGEMHIPDEIIEAARSNTELAKAIKTQTDLFNTQREMHKGRLGTLKQRIEQYNEEIIGLEAQVKSADAQLELIVEEVEPMQRLVDKGYVAKPQLLAIQRKKEELEGNRGQFLASIAKARQSIIETEMHIANTVNELATENMDETKDVQKELADTEAKLRAASDVMNRTIITSPYEGVVTGMQYHTVGGVIAPGTPIMDIIPQNELLIIEAEVKPTDIDTVKIGADTQITFSAYKTRRLPKVHGNVTYLSADALTTQNSAQAYSFYKARIEIDAEELARVDSEIRLYPGMPAEVFINTGSRSFLGYIFAPLTDSFNRAFRED